MKWNWDCLFWFLFTTALIDRGRALELISVYRARSNQNVNKTTFILDFCRILILWLFCRLGRESGGPKNLWNFVSFPSRCNIVLDTSVTDSCSSKLWLFYQPPCGDSLCLNDFLPWSQSTVVFTKHAQVLLEQYSAQQTSVGWSRCFRPDRGKKQVVKKRKRKILVKLNFDWIKKWVISGKYFVKITRNVVYF